MDVVEMVQRLEVWKLGQRQRVYIFQFVSRAWPVVHGGKRAQLRATEIGETGTLQMYALWVGSIVQQIRTARS